MKRNVLLALASTLVTLLLLEIGIRLAYVAYPRLSPENQLLRAAETYPPPFNRAECRPGVGSPIGAFIRPSAVREIIYELKPNVDGCFGYLGNRVKTNGHGFRAARDYPEKKPPGTLRIVGLGDSFMFGWGIEYEDTYSYKLERRLSQRLGRPVDFINTAVGGYNTVNEVAVLENRGVKFAPDLVVLHWYSNDFGSPTFLTMQRPHGITRWSVLAEFVLSRLLRLQVLQAPLGLNPVQSTEQDSLASTPDRFLDTEVFPDELPEEYRPLMGRAAVMRALDRLSAYSTARKIPVLVIGQFTSARAGEDLEGEFRRRGLLTAVMPSSPTFNVTKEDSHLNPVGHDAYTAEIEAALDRLGLLGPAQ